MTSPTPWQEQLDEAGAMHNGHCCVNSEHGCDTDVVNLECCENMMFLKSFISSVEQEAVERTVREIHELCGKIVTTDSETWSGVLTDEIEHYAKSKGISIE